MKVFSVHNGCESVLYDSEKAKLLLSGIGKVVDSKDKADLIIFHVCSFTQQKEEETIKRINSILNESTGKIIVSGCFLKEYVKHERISYVKHQNLQESLLEIKKEGLVEQNESALNLKPFVAISRGCYGYCSYCSIKKVKGNHISRPIQDILIDIDKRTDHGFVKLVGEEVAGYGIDIGTNLTMLVDEITKQFPKLKVSFGSLNPKLLKEYNSDQLNVFARKNIIGTIHIPIQSANNKILDLMNRDYTVEDFEEIIFKLKVLGVKKTSTDLICGFPGEDEKAHSENISFVQKHDFSFMEIFAFQERSGTKAALLDQVPYAAREKRTVEVIANYLKSYCKWKNITEDELIKLPKMFNTNIF